MTNYTPVHSASDLVGIVVVADNSSFHKLIELKDQKVLFPKSSDLLFVSPVFLFLLKNSSIVYSSNNSQFFLHNETTSLI